MAAVPSHNIDNAHIRPARYRYSLEPQFDDGSATCKFQVVGPPYRSLDPQKKEIRLIKIDHNPEPGLSIPFDLVEASLDHCPPFTALSYVWNPRVPVTLSSSGAEDGSESSRSYQATMNGNLSLALLHLRDDYQCDLVWADAICINQTDQKERSEQVAQMHTIYQTASQVIGWLGDLDILQPYVQQLKDWAEIQRSGDKLGEQPAWLQDANRESSLLHDEHYLQGLPELLLELDYWQRAWIFQEIANANEMRFAVGRASFSLQDLIDARRAWKSRYTYTEFMRTLNGMGLQPSSEAKENWLALPHPDLVGHYQLLGESSSASTMIEMVEQVRDQNEEVDSVRPERISLHFFETFSRLSATDPRDFIFALWGFVDRNSPHAELLKPNYEIETTSVFINAATYFIKAGKSLEVLKCQSFGESRLELPSWVPNWENAVAGSDVNTSKRHTKPHDALSEATSTQDPEFAENVKIVNCHEKGASLRVAGFQHTTVVEVIGSWLLPFGHDNHHESLQNFMKHILSGSTVRDRTSLYHFVQLLDLLIHPTEQGSLDSLYRDLEFQGAWPETPHPEFPSTGSLDSVDPSTYWADVMAARFLGASCTEESRTNLRKELADRRTEIRYEVMTDVHPLEFNFFRSSDNSIGACHRMMDVQKGDIICQFVVHPELFIIRKSGDSYKPVGECLIPDVKVKEVLNEVEWFNF